jgi:hypothetical protein
MIDDFSFLPAEGEMYYLRRRGFSFPSAFLAKDTMGEKPGK